MRKTIIPMIGGIMCVVGLFFTSCTKMDHFYEDFIVERTYIGKPDSIWIQPGDQRVLIGWLRPKDAEAKDLIIRYGTDSLVVAIDRGLERQSVIIENLEERDYVFTAFTDDRLGNRSVPMELSTLVYGDLYRSTFIERGFSHSVVFPGDSVAIVFSGLGQSETLYGSEIEFTDLNGVKQLVIARSTSSIGMIRNVDLEEPITMRTVFRPHPNAFEDFYLAASNVDVVATKRNTITFRSSEWANAEYVDFKFVRVFLSAGVPRPIGSDIDMAYTIGAGSRANLFAINSPNFSAFADNWQALINSWTVKNTGIFKKLVRGQAANDLYDSLDETNRSQMVAAFENSAVTGATRLSGLPPATGALDVNDIVLFHSLDRDIYVAMKVIARPPAVSGVYGEFGVEFKISRP